METKYFMVIDGRQAGPFAREELKLHGIKPESMVWREGLDNWVPATALPELTDLFAPVQQPPVYPGAPQPDSIQQPAGFGQYYGPQPADMQPQPIAHTNWLPWAIVCTVFGCMTSCITLILGIIGIVQANKANEMYTRGNRELGDSANSTAKTVTLCGIIIGVLSFLGLLALVTTGYFEHVLDMYEFID